MSIVRSYDIWTAVSIPWIIAAPFPYSFVISAVRLTPGLSEGASTVGAFLLAFAKTKHKIKIMRTSLLYINISNFKIAFYLKEKIMMKVFQLIKSYFGDNAVQNAMKLEIDL